MKMLILGILALFALPVQAASCFHIEANPPAEEVEYYTLYVDGVRQPTRVEERVQYSMANDFGMDLTVPHQLALTATNAAGEGPPIEFAYEPTPLPLPSAPGPITIEECVQ